MPESALYSFILCSDIEKDHNQGVFGSFCVFQKVSEIRRSGRVSLKRTLPRHKRASLGTSSGKNDHSSEEGCVPTPPDPSEAG